MTVNNLVPILVVIEENVVNKAQIYKNGEELEKAFSEECSDYGVQATNVDFDNGYMELEDGTSICMFWA